MIDNGLGFQLVPWSPSLEKQLGRHVAGVMNDGGGIDWGLGAKEGPQPLKMCSVSRRGLISRDSIPNIVYNAVSRFISLCE